MGLVKFKPYTVMPGVSSIFDEMFNDNFFKGIERSSLPKVNISELPNMYKLDLQAPGFNKEDISLTVEADVLRIKGEHKTESNKEEGKVSRREFMQSSFERSFTLPEGVKMEAIKASYEKGILSIEIPKQEAKPEKTAVQIKVD